jgi:hypothetical protein
MQENIITTDELMQRLAKAVGPGGDFPVSARVVKDLMDMTESATTTAQEVAGVIRRDPTLSPRLLSIVNSSFYGRVTPIKDLTQGVIQLGLRPLIKIVGSLILLKKFVPLARQDGPFAHALSCSITTALLHEQISFLRSKSLKKPTKGDPLLSMLSCLGQLLFSFFYAEIYETARLRSRERDISVSQSLLALTGATAVEMSIHVLESLHLSKEYVDVMRRASEMLEDWSFSQFGEGELNDDARVLAACLQISELLHSNISRAQFTSMMSELFSVTGLEHEEYLTVFRTLPEQLKDYCRNLELNVPSLPDFIKDISFDQNAGEETSQSLHEIREAVASGETLISIIGCTLDRLVNGMSFKRAVFLTPNGNKSMIEGRLAVGDLGKASIQSLKFPASVIPPGNAASNAWYYQKIEVTGVPIFPNSWPCVAFPVGFGDASVGVVYADMADANTQLQDSDIATISMMAEILDKSARSQKEGL